MTTYNRLVSAFIGALFFFSCGTTVETENEIALDETENSTIAVDAINEPEEVNINELYAESWESFKAAAKNKNTDAIKKHCTKKITDFDGLMGLLAEQFVVEQMPTVLFGDLEIKELEGQIYLSFYAENVGVDEYGYEYGSSVTLYFLETVDALLLDIYLVAG